MSDKSKDHLFDSLAITGVLAAAVAAALHWVASQ